MSKSIVTALAFAAFIAGPGVSTVMAADSSSDSMSTGTTKVQDCSAITDAQLHAKCLEDQKSQSQ